MNVFTSYLLALCSILMAETTPQAGEWIQIENLNFQQSGPCYDVAFYQDYIVFLNPENGSNYLSPLDRPDPTFSRPLFTNRDISCSPSALSFSDNYNKVYMTRPVDKSEQVEMESIVEMSIVDDQVSETIQLSLSGENSRNLHPAVSSDGFMMVFASDRLPTSGGLDLYITNKTDEGWSAPTNLGNR